MTAPRCAADPRPDGRPYYIDPTCPCGTALVLSDLLHNPATPADEVWHDEWTCPKCRNGIWMDTPDGPMSLGMAFASVDDADGVG